MHNFTLHRPVDTLCTCCGRVTSFVFKSPSDHVICKGCFRHQGHTGKMLMLAVQDHNNLWRSDLGVLREDHADEVARLNAKSAQRDEELAKLRVDLGDLQATVRDIGNGPLTDSVRRWFESEKVEDAEQKRDSAYRSRDYAYAAMWEFDQLHQEEKGNLCSCGKTTAKCREWQILEPHRPRLNSWEAKQVEFLKREQWHALPDSHPEVRRSGRKSYRYTA